MSLSEKTKGTPREEVSLGNGSVKNGSLTSALQRFSF